MPRRIIIDTNIMKPILEKNDVVIQRFFNMTYNLGAQFFISPIVYYEIMRGLLYLLRKRGEGEKKIEEFLELVKEMEWVDLIKEDWENATEIYSDLKLNGFSAETQDKDILIAAQAKRINAKVITNNLKDFQRINIDCETWL